MALGKLCPAEIRYALLVHRLQERACYCELIQDLGDRILQVGYY